MSDSGVARVYDAGVPSGLDDSGGRAGPAPFRAPLRAEAGEAARVREELVAFLAASGLPAGAAGDLALALAEALDNVIEHALAGKPGEEILVEAAVEGDGVRLEVRDRGPAFDPTTAPDPSPVPPEERRFGGFGLRLVRALVDEMRYERREGENRLLLLKRWSGP